MKNTKKTRRANHEGSIYYHNATGRWAGQVSIGYDGNGRKKRKTVYAKKQEDVVKKIAELKANSFIGIVTDPKKHTLASYLASWYKTNVTPRLKESTCISYDGTIRNHIIPALGGVKLEKVNKPMIKELLASLESGGKSIRLRQMVHDVLSSALSQAVDDDLILRSPMPTKSRPRNMNQSKAKFLTSEQSATFLSSAECDRFYALYLLALQTGMRRGELLALKWEDIDSKYMSISVSRTVSDIRGHLVIGTPKTDASNRKIALSLDAMKALEQHKLDQINAGLTTDLIFCNENGGLMRPNNLIRRSFRTIVSRANIPKIRFHDLRHTAATLMLHECKLEARVVQETLGHAKVQTTLAIYGHVLPDSQAEVANRMGALFRKKG